VANPVLLVLEDLLAEMECELYLLRSPKIINPSVSDQGIWEVMPLDPTPNPSGTLSFRNPAKLCGSVSVRHVVEKEISPEGLTISPACPRTQFNLDFHQIKTECKS
jgi:hypothetical protein